MIKMMKQQNNPKMICILVMQAFQVKQTILIQIIQAKVAKLCNNFTNIENTNGLTINIKINVVKHQNHNGHNNMQNNLKDNHNRVDRMIQF